MTADPYLAPTTRIQATDASEPSRLRQGLEKAWIVAAIAMTAMMLLKFFGTFRDALGMPAFWVELAWIPALLGTEMALASIGARWVWFGRKGPRAWRRGLLVLVPLVPPTILTTVVFPMGGGARHYAFLWLWTVIVCLAATVIVDGVRNVAEWMRGRS